jgi:hypothetical protein
MGDAKHGAIILSSKNKATHCFYCERAFENIAKDYNYAKVIKTIDHFYPLKHGGKNTNQNKVICCFLCNEFKAHQKPLVLFNLLIKDSHYINKCKKKHLPFDFDCIEIFITKLGYLTTLYEKKQMISPDGYYIKKEQTSHEVKKSRKSTTKEEEVTTVDSRRYKNPLTNWLTYGT